MFATRATLNIKSMLLVYPSRGCFYIPGNTPLHLLCFYHVAMLPCVSRKFNAKPDDAFYPIPSKYCWINRRFIQLYIFSPSNIISTLRYIFWMTHCHHWNHHLYLSPQLTIIIIKSIKSFFNKKNSLFFQVLNKLFYEFYIIIIFI